MGIIGIMNRVCVAKRGLVRMTTAVVLGTISCSGGPSVDVESRGRSTSALSMNDRVFMFEGPVGPSGDWAATAGVATPSSTAHLGSKALSLAANGNWNPTVVSRSMTTLGPIASALKVWVRFAPGYVCQPGSWCGQVAAFLSVPSRGINNLALTPAALVGPTGTWREYSMPLPSNVVETLSSTTYSDFRVTLRINGSATSNVVLIDDLSFGSQLDGPRHEPGIPDQPPLGPNEMQATFDLPLPADLRRLDSAVVGFESVELDPGAQVLGEDGFSGVTNLGLGLLRVGTGVKVASVLAKGAVELGQNSHVYGDVIAEGEVEVASGSVVDGATEEGQVLSTLRMPSRVRFAKTPQPAVQLGTNQVRTVPLAPGRYQSLSLASGAELPLVAGRYLFDSISLAPGSRLKIKDAAGAVEVYADTALTLRGRILRDVGGQPNLVFTYFGTGTVAVSGPLRGMLIAPQGTVFLQDITGPVPIPEAVHRGIVMGKIVRVQGTIAAVAPDAIVFQCVAKPNGTPCSDGDNCTVSDACNNGSCHGVPKTCGPSSECMQRTACEPETGACGTAPQREGEPCGSPADGTCVGGVCTTPGMGRPTEVTSHSTPHVDSELGDVQSEELQGVAHSDTYWFWVHKAGIQRVLRGESLISPYSGGIGIPSQFSGYTHFGDADFANGFLFAPLSGDEETPPRVLVVFDEELNVRAWAFLPNRDSAWVGVNPVDGRLYTSKPFDTLHAYDIGALLAAAQAEVPSEAVLTEVATVKLVLDDIRPASCPEKITGGCGGRTQTCIPVSYMTDPCATFWSSVWTQGGDISPNGILYYALDYKYAEEDDDFTGVIMASLPRFHLPVPVPPEETPPAFLLPVAPDGLLNIKYDGIMSVTRAPFVSLFVDKPSRARELEGLTVFRDPEGGATHGLVVELINNVFEEDNATIHRFSTDE